MQSYISEVWISHEFKREPPQKKKNPENETERKTSEASPTGNLLDLRLFFCRFIYK